MSNSYRYTAKYEPRAHTAKYRRPTRKEIRELDRIADALLSIEFSNTRHTAPQAPNKLV